MPRESEAYRDHLERLDAAFPGREFLTKNDIAAYCGCNRTTVWRRLDLPAGKVTKVTLARRLARE